MCFLCIYNARKYLYFKIKTVFILPYNTQTKRLSAAMFHDVVSTIIRDLAVPTPC